MTKKENGIVELGVDGIYNVIFSNKRLCLYRISLKTKKKELESLFDLRLLELNFPNFDIKKRYIGIDWKRVLSEVSKECLEIGNYSESIQ